MKPGSSSVNCVLPKFVKVYHPGESGDDLVLPVSFNGFLPKSLPRSVTVRSLYEKIWNFALKKRCGDDDERYVLVNGWKKIVKDEDLSRGDFLVFEFDGSSCFNFSIWEHRTMRKRLRRSSVKDEEIETVSDDDEEEEEESEDSEDSVLEDDDDDDDSDDADYAADDDNDVEVEPEPEHEHVDDDDVDDGDVDADADDDRRYLDDRENPSFSTTLNPKKKSQLRIPAHVVNDYGLTFPASITIVDPLERKFGTIVRKIKIQNNGCVFVKGFGIVIRRNQVKTTDKMIFEIKKTGRNMVHTMKVHIIRG